MLCKYWFTFVGICTNLCFCLPVHAHTYGNIKFRREDHFWAHHVMSDEESASVFCESEWMGIHLPSERFALAHLMRSWRRNALWTFVIKITLQKKEKKVMSESFHRFFLNSLNEWRISCFSVGGARALDEVRFIPLSRPRSHHQWKNHRIKLSCSSNGRAWR